VTRSRPPLVVAALGGNALLRRGEPLTAEAQEANVATACRALAEVAHSHHLAVTHGNGPQVGLLALQAEAYREVPAYPLDVLGAESEGMIGYLLDRHLANALPTRQVVTLLTQVVVDPDDPAFAKPTKPIGPVYDKVTADRLAHERGWQLAPDGRWYRRVVPSPDPRSIVELSTIALLVNAGVVVVCAGGGGIPVVEVDSCRRGVEAVVDKDTTAALLATGLDADVLMLLTDVPGVYDAWGTDDARLIERISSVDLQTRQFASGSMAPKVAAAIRFVAETGRRAAIGRLEDAAAIVAGEAGTLVLPDARGCWRAA
jgi:carbamate kinase